MDWKRISFFIFSVFCGVFGGAFGQKLIHGNDAAINVIVTVFSILAGFLVAIMTIMGDPGAFSGRSWRVCEANRSNVFNQLIRQKWMFTLYLVTLGLIFIASLAKAEYPSLTVWIEKIFLGTAITAFILSFRMPAVLMNIQLSRHDDLINTKRKSVGIKD